MDGGSGGVSRKPRGGWEDPLWERQAGEGMKAFEAFGVYRDLGPTRSGAKVANAQHKSSQLIARWMQMWGWVERAGAWDDQADRLRRERDQLEADAARRKMREEHLTIGRAFVQVTAAGLKGFDSDTAEGRAKIAALTASDMARLAEAGVRLELRARGESQGSISEKDAQAFVEGLMEISLGYISSESHEAFIADVEAKLGTGTLGLS